MCKKRLPESSLQLPVIVSLTATLNCLSQSVITNPRTMQCKVKILHHLHACSGRRSASAEGQQGIHGPLHSCSEAHTKIQALLRSPVDPLLSCISYISAKPLLCERKSPLCCSLNSCKSTFPTQTRHEKRSHEAAQTSGSGGCLPGPELIITCAQEAGWVSCGRLLPTQHC